MIIVIGCTQPDDENSGNGQNDAEVDNEGDWEGQSLTVQLIGDFSEEPSTDPITGEKTGGVNVLKDEFERLYPGASVNFIIMPWEGYVEKTQAMLTSNEADVYQMPGIADFAPQGVLEPLQDYIDNDEDFDLDIFFDNQIEGWKVNGPDSTDLEIYGLPFLGDARFIVYDKQIFDEWDVDYPSDYPTMEEIGELAKKMTGTNPETGEQNYGIWYRGDWDSAFRVVNVAEGLDGSWGSGYAWEEVEFNFDSPEMVEALEWLLEMKEYAPDGIVSDQGNEKWLTEDNNIAIMLNQGPGNINSIYAQGFDDRIDIAQEFKNSDGVGGQFAGSPIAIAKDSENKDLAWEWLKFATSEFAQKFIFEETADGNPSIKAAYDWESTAEKDLMLKVFEAMETPWTPRYPWASSQPRFILTTEVEATLTGKRTPEEALEKAQKESEEWLENR